MLEKLTKKFGSRATDGAIEGAKESLNTRLDKYSDIIEIGLVVAVIALGGNKLIGHGKKKEQTAGYLPAGGESGSPIVINNYYTGQPLEKNIFAQKGARASNGREKRKNHQKY